MAGQRAWAPVGSPVSTPPLRGCIRSAVVNPPQARGGNRADGRHDDPTGWERLYMIPSSNCSEALFLPLCFHSGLPLTARARLFLSLCLHSGASLSAGCRVAPVALSPLRYPGSFPAGIDCIGFPIVNLPGVADWAQGLPGGAPKHPYPKRLKNDIATDPLLNGPREPFLTPWRSRMQGQEKSFDKDKLKSV